MRLSSWRPRAWSVRVRTGVAAGSALAVVLLLASVVAVTVQRHELIDSVALVAEEQARTAARELAQDGVSADREAPLVGSLGGEETLLQVVGVDGVLRSSPDLATSTALVPAPSATATSRAIVSDVVAGEGDRFVAVGVPVSDSQLYVVGVRSLETVDTATASTTRLLLVGVPVLVAVVVALGWLLAGRALAPVERLRRTAAEITTAGSGRRLPAVPGGDEVASLAVTLNEMLGRLDASARAQRQFVADASHELRSPVATIRTLLEVDARAPSDRGELREDLLAETTRLERLVAALLSLARRDATEPGERSGPNDAVRLADLVREETMRSRRVPVRLQVDSDPLVHGDRQALATLLTNLLDNADRHAHSHVVTSLRVDDDRRVAVLTVSDDGPGVAPEDRERIFDRFVRLDEARTRDVGGAGLGLAIARAVAEDHGGTLSCHDPDPEAHLGQTNGARMVWVTPLAVPE